MTDNHMELAALTLLDPELLSQWEEPAAWVIPALGALTAAQTFVQLKAALTGAWGQVKTAAETEARVELADRFAMAALGLGWRVAVDCPRGLVVTTEGPDPVRGTIRETWPGLQEFHWEFPVDGMGICKDRLRVVEGEHTTPIFEWLRLARVIVVCARCGGLLDRRAEQRCPWKMLREQEGVAPRRRMRRGTR